jgi:hypothetical protein
MRINRYYFLGKCLGILMLDTKELLMPGNVGMPILIISQLDLKSLNLFHTISNIDDIALGVIDTSLWYVFGHKKKGGKH